MKIERHQGNALTGAFSKNDKHHKYIFKNPDKLDLLTTKQKQQHIVLYQMYFQYVPVKK